MLARLPPKRGLKYYVALQYWVLNTKVRVEEVEDNYVSSFNLFRLCKVEKLRQTALISFPYYSNH